MEIRKVAVLGCGLMGSQIAMQVAISGYDVVCYTPVEAEIQSAIKFSEGWFEKSIAKEKITEDLAKESFKRLTYATDLATCVKDADLVIEAVVELLDVKRAVLKEIDALTPDHTIFASNSSYIVSSRFADAVKRPERVLNLHFFNPALVMKLVEIVKGPHVSDEVVEVMIKFVESIDKLPVVVEKEIHGFIVNRFFDAITREACYLYDMGIASVESIDIAVKNGLSHPMGPFELLDMVGIDLQYYALSERYKDTGDPADKPSPALVEQYAKKQFGRKTKKGFYDYE